MKSEAIVIGAGMVGVSVAWHLQQRGFQVRLLDSKAPGEETSYGNAGLIQREAIYPHGFPIGVKEMLRILPNNSLDIRYRPMALAHYRGALWQYWKSSQAKPFAKIVEEWTSLVTRCTDEHEHMFEAAGATHLIRKVGWLQLFREQSNFQAEALQAQRMAKHGVEYRILSVADIQALEPDLNADAFVGGIHWLNSWQVSDPAGLVKAYARHFEALGGVIEQTTVKSMMRQGDTWHIGTDTEHLETQNVVIATGPWSADLLRPLGYDFPLFPIRGYHRHYRMKAGTALNHSIVDNESGFVLGPKTAGIRLTTGAEFTMMDAPIRIEQLQDDEKVARELLPLTEAVEETPWFGHRPCMPDMKPVIGKAHNHDGLWFAFGHAHQGFTLGPVTGKLLAQMMTQETPDIDPAPFAANRFN